MTLADYAPTSIWFASVGIPTGIDIDLTTIEDPDTGENVDLDPYDAENSIPFGFDLEGTVDEGGDWNWDGEGNPLDWNRNTVTLIRASK